MRNPVGTIDCKKCGKTYNYLNTDQNDEFYIIERHSTAARGSQERVAYCIGCAPLGNTKIPDHLGL